jgi:LEA14-like dessication related protein
LIIIVVGALVGLGVYYYNAYHNLKFEITNVNIENLTLRSATLNFGLTLNNTNPLPLYIPNGSFQIYINGEYLGAGTFNALTIPGNSVAEIGSPVTFNTADIPSAVYGLIMGAGNVTVTAQGTINLWLRDVPFNTTLYDTKIS